MRRSQRGGGSGSSPLATTVVAVLVCAFIHVCLSAMLPTPAPLRQSSVRETVAPSVTAHHAPGTNGNPYPSTAKVFRSADPVVAHEPYKPVFKGWSKRVFPTSAGTRPGGKPTDCVAWRQTGSCRPDGPREAFFDLPCTEKVQTGKSGYCQCGDNSHKAGVSCTQYRPFTCADVCAGLADPNRGGAGGFGGFGGDEDDGGGQAAGLIANPRALNRRVESDGHAVVDGHRITPFRPSDEAVERAKAKLAQQRRGRKGDSPKQGAAPRRLAQQPMPEHVSEPHCHSFQQTRGCDPHGPPEGNRRGCDDIVPAGISGYCVCGNGYAGPGVGCDHPPFTCHDGCDPTLAKEMDEVLGKHLPPADPPGGDSKAAPDDEEAADADLREALAQAATAHFERQLSDGDGKTPVRVLDRVELTDADRAEVAEMQAAARRRAAEIRAVDDARRRGDLGPTRRFVAGGGPVILERHDAFDADVAHQLAEAAKHRDVRAPPPDGGPAEPDDADVDTGNDGPEVGGGPNGDGLGGAPDAEYAAVEKKVHDFQRIQDDIANGRNIDRAIAPAP